ncbi:hypothetical protein ACTG9Q_24755 [Actinokineospora sp. 24-640]
MFEVFLSRIPGTQAHRDHQAVTRRLHDAGDAIRRQYDPAALRQEADRLFALAEDVRDRRRP